ncbi:hypothetical protein [Pseudoxanthomonas mexicana]
MTMKKLEKLTIVIPGSCTLKDIKNVIRFHEASLWVLDDLAVDGRMNKASFLPADDVPNDLEFLAETAPAPSDSTQVWSGKLRYNSSEQRVVLYRAN